MNILSNIFIMICVYFCYVLTKILPLFLKKKNGKDKSVLFLENFPIENAGYQYRAYKWTENFKEKGVKADVWTIIQDKQTSDKISKFRFLLVSLFKRLRQCIASRNYFVVVVRRELLQFNDYGNCFMEKFLLKIHPNVVLDFDDDISASKRQPRQITSLYAKLLMEDGNKFNNTLRLYKKFVVGSEYLKQRVLSENQSIKLENIIVIPTCVDYDKCKPKVYDPEKLGKELAVGWVGGSQNLHYLDIVIDSLNKLNESIRVKLIVVSGKVYKNDFAKFKIENYMWSLSTEQKMIRSFDIGIMPIFDTCVGKGKCGFKLLQYMGLGVVSIATGVTVNNEIIDNGNNGFIVESDNSSWYDVFRLVAFMDVTKFQKIGNKARTYILENYSFFANGQKYLNYLTNENLS